MATPRSRQAARLRARQRRAQQRARRLAVLAIIGVLALVTLVLTAFGSGSTTPATVRSIVPAPVLDTTPMPQILATVGNLHLQAPISAATVTGIGFHGSRNGALELQPVGRQANQGVLARLWRRIAGAPSQGPVWYQLGGRNGGGTSVLDVGAAAGTVVYAPADGAIASMTDFVIDGKRIGTQLEIRPSISPSVIVTVYHLRPDPSLSVGSQVMAGVTKIGTVVDVARFERQALAKHAADRGNNVAIEVHPAAGSLP